ncbi:GGDEF domain-containing protein [Grimontia sp. NTOU-MAR1]|uniref:GGDEF domain-containing protein n=1 Tax=Grimontia sp. NTOU-MAR1 TaxID=3111011 RepID=UPI002DBB6946|nr:GGDEF domain-containing protein [Grimontia sp. NTOU-MAR1]WRV96416.1 GGDEF domain-containing protein [Grimontia sp. NTOU-MAR1]
MSYKFAAEQLILSAESKLVALLDSRKESLLLYFDTVKRDLFIHARSPQTRDAVIEITEAWEDIGENQESTLQSLYITDNLFDVGQKEALLYAEDGSAYSKAHKKYHSFFRNLAAEHGYYDIFLVDREGNILYSVKKEDDFATNLLNGKWQDTHLARAFTMVNKNPSVDNAYLTDFEKYEPSFNQPEAFFATPIHRNGEEYIGALIFQMPIKYINSVMQVSAGMGETGETVLIGPDELMRSNSRFHGEKILEASVHTNSAAKALSGISGIQFEQDNRGVEVLSAFAPFNFMSLHWAIIAEIERDEILSPLRVFVSALALSVLVGTVVIFVMGYFLALDIAKPIAAMSSMMNRLANNELDINISVSERKDEVGHMAQALEIFKTNAIEKDKLQKELTYMAHHDMLTGLPTRQLITDRLQDMTKSYNKEHFPFAVMFADLDNFKTVNDTLGHHIGDEVLKAAARIFQEALRDGDFVARIGGDEFVLLFTNIQEADEAMEIAKKLVVSIETGLKLVSTTIPVTLSLGIAVCPDDAEDTTSLIRHADEAMYRAKQKSKNCCSR